MTSLQDPFATPDGARIATPAAWPARAAAWRDALVDVVYGGLPPAPADVRLEVLGESRAGRLRGRPLGRVVRVRAGGGALPVTLRVSLLARGVAVAVFDRTEVAADQGARPGAVPRRSGGLYDAYPGGTFGALAAWAWAYHRCVDLLQATPEVDPARIAVTGFVAWRWLGGAPDPAYGRHPYPDMAPAFAWRAPDVGGSSG